MRPKDEGPGEGDRAKRQTGPRTRLWEGKGHRKRPSWNGDKVDRYEGRAGERSRSREASINKAQLYPEAQKDDKLSPSCYIVGPGGERGS